MQENKTHPLDTLNILDGVECFVGRKRRGVGVSMESFILRVDELRSRSSLSFLDRFSLCPSSNLRTAESTNLAGRVSRLVNHRSLIKRDRNSLLQSSARSQNSGQDVELVGPAAKGEDTAYGQPSTAPQTSFHRTCPISWQSSEGSGTIA